MASVRQEMPRKGGYSPIVYQRNALKPLLPLWFKVIVGTAAVGYGWWGFSKAKVLREWERVERFSAFISLLPLYKAEKDRNLLRHLRNNRDYEAELMKDVEGWEVGTLHGEKLFKTLGPDEWVDPAWAEVYAHASPYDRRRAVDIVKEW